jgi:hypothetical protein
VLALLIASAWVVFGITTPVVALTGFASANWVFVVAALIISTAITSTGSTSAANRSSGGACSEKGDCISSHCCRDTE